jgi:hypothetical protein
VGFEIQPERFPHASVVLAHGILSFHFTSLQ